MAFKRTTGVRSPIQPQQVQKPQESGMMFAEVSMLLTKLQGMEKNLIDAKAEVMRVVNHALTISQGQQGIQGRQGIKGDKGDKGDSIVGPRGPQGEKGDRGDMPTVDERSIAEKVAAMIRTPEDGKDAIIDYDKIKEEVFSALKKDKKLKPEDIDGWEQTIGPIRSLAAGFRGGGDTVTAGSNITITTNANGQKVIAAAGASLSIITVTGTVDDSNTSFTAASAPTVVVVNGASYINGAGVTIVGTAITLDNPVGTGGSIYAL